MIEIERESATQGGACSALPRKIKEGANKSLHVTVLSQVASYRIGMTDI
jgi:hypothetical protein